MDRRGFLTATLLSLAVLAASAADAAPLVAPRDVIAPSGQTEDVWWRRWRWRRRRWWGWRRRYYYRPWRWRRWRYWW
ncbi:hypothetical protein [Methylocystis bryophila]|uniref:Twin-arginine translocation (Tat) n=1 Tax=Methylocystis bryophila TaxID=655015 RepID=A0A1W6N1I9_9HYPH|nr:hypothetical protein [Methylocystis bryophila]ARN83703.1 hypothetical protein B1812_15810 [Methylocystis bryophila]